MAESLLFGLSNSNHVFDEKHTKSFGKNIFTNAFPIALAQYMDSVGIGPICIRALIDGGKLATEQVEVPFSDLLGCDVKKARWQFEESYSEYQAYATGTPNRSDIVVVDGDTGKQATALEVKLVTARIPLRQICHGRIRAVSSSLDRPQSSNCASPSHALSATIVAMISETSSPIA